MSVKEAFNRYAMVYDQTRRKFIPCFDEFYGVALRLLPKDIRAPKILDLGAGTGLVSAMVLERFPEARILLTDISDAMLAQARARFSREEEEKKRPQNLDFQVLDYTRTFPKGPFDAVISALSIHHLDHDEKAALFRRIHRHLVPGGMFINADQALGETDEIDDYYRECWFERIVESGVTDEEMAGALERMKEDRMSTLKDQLAWLEEAGFRRVNCWYKYYNFVVYSGTKESAGL